MNDEQKPMHTATTETPQEIEVPAALPLREEAEAKSSQAIAASLVQLGFINFDAAGTDNTTSGAMVSPEFRKDFRRDVYVGIKDDEQNLQFLGRIVEGPFHAPHEV